MITLSAEITIKEGGQITNGSINEPSSDKSNVSCEFNEILNRRANGKNLFFTDYSIVDKGDVYGDKVNYYISGRASDVNSSFSPAYVITLNNYNYDYVIIEFDKLNKEYPQTITVNGKTYTDNDPVWEIGNIPKTSDNKVVITIGNWNKPNRPLTIQGIYNGISLKIDTSNMVSCERSLFDRSDVKLPSYGIISNSGSLTFFDRNEEVSDYIEQGLLSTNGVCKLYMENSLTKKRQQIGTYLTSDWKYDSLNKEVTIELKDSIERLQKIKFDIALSENITLLDCIDLAIQVATANGFNVINNCTYNSRYDLLFLKDATLWSFFQYACDVANLFVYQDSVGNIIIQQEKR